MKAMRCVFWLNKLWDFHAKECLSAPKRMKATVCVQEHKDAQVINK